jgi:hypothetical protein
MCGGVRVAWGERMKKMRVVVYGGGTLSASMKDKKETSWNCFKGGWEEAIGRECGHALTHDVQYNSICNCPKDSSLYEELILIKTT